MKSRFTLLPSELFSEDNAREILSEVVPLSEGEPLSFIELPERNAVLVYAGERRPAVYDLAVSLFKIPDFNKILADWTDSTLSLVIAQGENLVLCNEYEAADFVTAQYYIFAALQKLQINPLLSTVYFSSDIDAGRLISLCSYFKNAERLQ